MKSDLLNINGEKVGEVLLNDKIFSSKENISILHESVVNYQNNQRSGSANTKTRAEVRGGGIKPWRQKGTGRARVGSIRSPLWRGGGVTFGPRTKNFTYHLPKKKKKISFLYSFICKIKRKKNIYSRRNKI
ncbi:MAG: 50S ribosomal protein L4 [bacterium]